MKRFLVAGLILLNLGAPVAARTVEERLIAGLKSQGYVIVEDGFTFLGRLRIVAESALYHREIVVNPETGEVLRDYVVLMADLLPPKPGSNAVASSGADRSSADTAMASAAGGGTVGSATDTLTMSAPGEPAIGADLPTDPGAEGFLLADPLVIRGAGSE